MKTNNWRGGIGYIETYSDGTYQPVEDGKKAWIVSVDREVSDLVAWLSFLFLTSLGISSKK